MVQSRESRLPVFIDIVPLLHRLMHLEFLAPMNIDYKFLNNKRQFTLVTLCRHVNAEKNSQWYF